MSKDNINPLTLQFIKEIHEEVNLYADKTKAEMFTDFVNNMLQKTLCVYNVESSKITQFLADRVWSGRVAKAVNKMKKAEDKEIIEQNLNKDN